MGEWFQGGSIPPHPLTKFKSIQINMKDLTVDINKAKEALSDLAKQGAKVCFTYRLFDQYTIVYI